MVEDANNSGDERGLLPVVLAFVAGVVLVALVVTAVVFFMQSKERGDELAAQDESSQAACDFARVTNTYDYTGNLDSFLPELKGRATENVVSDLEQNWEVLRGMLGENQVKAWVDKSTCGFRSGDAENTQVLVNLSLMNTNKATPEPKRLDIAVIAGMEKSGDKWLVNKWELAMLPGLDPSATEQQPAPPADQPAPEPGN
ncbi:hypothetical protein GV794_00455 [Nocardia cyriacigeorgica]|uniref:Mce-associated membrane protein n=1 Tax=Nocardia cyriacigeorgica TaxID=135487 RepID=A0A6P1D5Z1_9NOCA|nr:hypothetical protein [Nocardia cyriacigeorgica]NEW38424.1 hypothetical protein [Nocardia cyriacigeorgica]NEW43612.1 hypothetical protein [Nocardia cyriacigeorgica]NEW49452.1 hypothetical protein [Nocardia cyriacigeorgica]NEW54144.1 hypothetical protein [Nocardia cyriacigeorgica]